MKAYLITTTFITLLLAYFGHCGCGPECKDPDTGRDYPVGMSWTSKDATGCGLNECVQGDGNKTVIIKRTCPAVEAGKGCKITEVDNEKEYPECCRTVVCS